MRNPCVLPCFCCLALTKAASDVLLAGCMGCIENCCILNVHYLGIMSMLLYILTLMQFSFGWPPTHERRRSYSHIKFCCASYNERMSQILSMKRIYTNRALFF